MKNLTKKRYNIIIYLIALLVGIVLIKDVGSSSEVYAATCSHVWTKTNYKAATCTSSGSQGYTCSKCKATKTDTISALGHTSPGYVERIEATCTQNGYIRRHCLRCDTVLSEIILTSPGHNEIVLTDIPSTCKEAGRYVTICSVCGVILQNIVPPLKAHSYVYGVGSSHTEFGHWACDACTMCGDNRNGHYVYDDVTYTEPHTPTGHLIQTVCSYCRKVSSSYYTTITTCLSCTTPPSVSFNNVAGSTVLTEANTAFQVQIKVKDNENDTLTCNYYLDGSPTSAGTVTATGTSTQRVVSFINTINVMNLSEGSHTIRVTAKDSIAPAGEASVTFKVDKSAPVISSVAVEPSISGVKLTAAASDSISGLAAGAYRYTVGGVITGWISPNYYTFPDLTADTSYSYTVEVLDKVGHISQPYGGTFSTKVDIPVVTATALSENMIKIIIKDSNPAATYYRIQVTGSGYADASGSIVSTESWITLPYDPVAGGKLLTLSGLASNFTYNISVSTRNTATGAVSTGTVVSTLTSPEAPGNLTSPSKSYDYIQLGWGSVPGAVGYQLSREVLSGDGVTYMQEITVDTALLTSQDSDVLAGQNYRYKVRAKNAAGIYGGWSQYLEVKTLPVPPAKVTGVAAAAEGNTLDITWDQIPGAIGYKVIIAYDGTSIEQYSAANQTICPIDRYNCQCDITVQAFNVWNENDINNTAEWSNGSEVSESITCYTDAEVPVMDLAVLNITPNSVTVMWQADGNPDSVEYVLGVFNSDTLVSEYNYKSISLISGGCSVTGLEPETAYTFKVKAVNSSGAETEWSNAVSAATLMDFPDIPGRLRATAKADNIALLWDPSEKAQGYQIERDGEIIATGYTACSYTDTGLTPETGYTYRVSAVNTTGESSWSQPLTKKTLGNLPYAPVITAVSGSSISVGISWTPVDGASGYDIEADGQPYNVGLDTSYIHNGLMPGSYHSYRVRTRNIYGKGEWSQAVTYQTVPALPGIPGNITADTSDTQILVSWAAAGDATAYDVEIDGTVYSDIEALQYLYTLQGENLGGSEYTVRVRATNSGGQGEWSEACVAVIKAAGEGSLPADPIPMAPSVACSVSGSAIVAVSWNEVEGATVYQLEADNTVIYTGPGTSYAHTGLVGSSQHQYRVSAGNLSGFSDWSNPTTAITDAVVSTTPENITYYRENDTLMTIAWDSAYSAIGYRIEVNGVLSEGIISDIKTSIATVSGEQYNIRIASVIPDGDAEILDWSEEITFRTPDKLPGVPAIEDITATSDTITASWGEVTGATGYEIEADGKIMDIRSTLEYNITNLEPSSSHRIKLRAYNEAGSGDWSEENTIMTNEGIPGVPINIIGSPVGDISVVTGTAISLGTVSGSAISVTGSAISVTGSAISATGSAITLKWDGPEGASSYEVEDEEGNIYPVDTDEVVVYNLLPGRAYTFRVRAVTEAGAGAWSSRIAVVPVVMIPKNISLTAENGIVHISWDNAGAESYEVELDSIIVATSEGTGIDFNYETFYKQRTVRIRACSSDQKSEWSQTVIFNQPLPVTVELTENEEISILLPVSNADINKYKLTLTYNPEELALMDSFEITPEADTQSVYIEEYNTYIIIEQKDGIGSITFLVQAEGNDYFTGTVSSLRFRSLITGTATISYGVTEK